MSSAYEQMYNDFYWDLPQHFNIAAACLAHPADRVALLEEGLPTTYGQLDDQSSRLAWTLKSLGVRPGDRVAILLSQGAELVTAHLACYRMAAIAVPLFALFGPDAVQYRLNNCAAVAIVTDSEHQDMVADMLPQIPALTPSRVIVAGGVVRPGLGSFEQYLSSARGPFPVVPTLADDPAVIIYTSGTTGSPKGALHAHRILLGHLPGVSLSHNLAPAPGDRIWTPADWAWIGGLYDVLFPALFWGIPVVARRMRKFDPEEAFRLLEQEGIRNTFLPPTALKMMRQVPEAASRYHLHLRSVASGGETLGQETLAMGPEVFGVAINEFYGQTECNMVLSNCAALRQNTPGSAGKPVFGHTVAIVGPQGQPLAPGEVGTIAVKTPDPVLFLGYWQNPTATAAKFCNHWLMTGDLGYQSDAQDIFFVSRDDDLISSGGYRIGPGEIEDSLLRHPAVLMAAVIGKPDPVRLEIVTYIPR
jgi:acetyl-CoA synthetase